MVLRVPRLHSTFSSFVAPLLAAAIAAVGLVGAGIGPAAGDGTSQPASPAKLQGDSVIRMTLNRLAYGPRPGDIERVRQMGVQKWIEQQLNPETIADNEVDTSIVRLEALRQSPAELMATYLNDRKQAIKNQKKKNQLAGANPGVSTPAPDGAAQAAPAAPAPDPTVMNAQPEMAPGASIEAVGELDAAKLLRACDSNRQLQEVLVDFWSNHFNEDVKKGPVRTLKIADERDVIRPHVFGKFRDLLEASARSPAMLFYLDNASSTVAGFQPGRQGNRANQQARAQRQALLRFQRRQALLARRFGFVPPPLVTPGNVPMPAAAPPAPGTPGAVPANKKRLGGLNENYGRELMELHTLGVDGGYTQKDVQEVARCLTGWGFNRQTGEFQFTPRRHDNGQKVVLGHVIPPGGGIQDGETVLDILASHPSTAHFISRKLCARLVSDNPPPALVDRVAQTFLHTGGDLKSVYRAIIYSPEFWTTASYDSKVKSPFEFAVSAVRALDGHFEVPDPTAPRGRVRLIADGAASIQKAGNKNGGRGRKMARSIAQEIADMGQPLFSYEAPTGYPERSAAWISSGGLLARFNYALALAGGQLAEVRVSPGALVANLPAGDPGAVVDHLGQFILGGDISSSTKSILVRQARQGTRPDRLAALLLSAPEFQKH